MTVIDLTEEEKKALEKFPKYDDKPEHWVGSREYWESIFSNESNRDPELHKAFSELHKEIVDKVIQFCQEHDLDVDEFRVHADGLIGSKDFGQWTCATDSSMFMYKMKKDKETGWLVPDREYPFLYEI